MASLTVENYVKTIFSIAAGDDQRSVTTGEIANHLGVSPGTVTSMLKSLSESGLIRYTPYEGAQLTETGSALALRIVRRHRLIELFLYKTLGLGWDEVHADAEQMEHVVSDLMIERIEELLGNPRFDPHGDPIPSADGVLPAVAGRSLVDCEPGVRFRIARVTDQSTDFLRFLSRAGLVLEVEGTVRENLAQAGTITVEAGGQQTTLGREAALHLMVVEVSATPRRQATWHVGEAEDEAGAAGLSHFSAMMDPQPAEG